MACLCLPLKLVLSGLARALALFTHFSAPAMAIDLSGDYEQAHPPGTLSDDIYKQQMSRPRYLLRHFIAKFKENESETIARWQVF